MYVGSRRELLWTLRDRARRAEDEQATRVAAARTAERTRIAREMHDVLAHRISLVTMHADAMVYRTDLGTEELRESAAVIQESSHRALVELREVLGVLRDDPGDAEPERPQPGARDVPALVDELLADGMRLDVDLGGTDLGAVPDTAGRTLYRVVQEALTNARKHAPNALVQLSVRAGPATAWTSRCATRSPPAAAPAHRSPGWAWSGWPSAPRSPAAGSSTTRTAGTSS